MERKVKIFALLLLGLFVFSILGSFAFAANDTTVNINAGKTTVNIITQAKDSLKGFALPSSPEAKQVTYKILFGLLLLMIIYSITSFLPFIPRDKPYLNWGIAIIITLISILFINGQDLEYIAKTYESMGLILTAIIPFIIIVVFTFELRVRSPVVATIVNPIILFGFIIFSMAKWVSYDWDPSKGAPFMVWTFPIVILATLLWFFFERTVAKKVFKTLLSADTEEVEQEVAARKAARLQSDIQLAADARGRTRDTMQKVVQDDRRSTKDEF